MVVLAEQFHDEVFDLELFFRMRNLEKLIKIFDMICGFGVSF